MDRRFKNLCIDAFDRWHALYVDINQFLQLLLFLNSSAPFWTLNQAIKCQDLRVAVSNLVILDNCYLEWLWLIPPKNHSSATHRALYRVNYEENFAGGFYYFDPVRRHYNHLKYCLISCPVIKTRNFNIGYLVRNWKHSRLNNGVLEVSVVYHSVASTDQLVPFWLSEHFGWQFQHQHSF